MIVTFSDFVTVGRSRQSKTTWTDSELLTAIEVTQAVAAYYCLSEISTLVLLELRALEMMANCRSWKAEKLDNGYYKWTIRDNNDPIQQIH